MIDVAVPSSTDDGKIISPWWSSPFIWASYKFNLLLIAVLIKDITRSGCISMTKLTRIGKQNVKHGQRGKIISEGGYIIHT